VGGRLPAVERRAAILGSAASLFATRGFAGVTTRELAAAAGVSEATLYKHFPDKEAMYGAILERHLEEMERAFPIAGLAASDAPPERFFTDIGGTILRRMEADPTLLRLMFYSALEGHPLARDVERARARRLRDAIAAYLRRRAKAGEIRPIDANVAARSFVWLIVGFGLSRVLFREPGVLAVPRPVLVRRIVRQFLAGLLPALLAAAALAGCASGPSPLERAARAPVPLVGEAFAGAAPSVLPDRGPTVVAETLAAARARGSLSLEDCVRTSLATREDLVSGDEDRLQLLLRKDLALAAMLPEARMLLRHDRQDPASVGGSTTTSTEPVRTQWSINVMQPLFRGFREFHAVHSAEESAAATADDVRNLRRALATSVARAFMQAVESDAEIRSLEDALRLDEARVQEMTARSEQGLARKTEVLLQESRRETTRAAVSVARERRDAARVLLEGLAGTRIDLPLDPVAAAADSAPVPSREEALAQAFRLRPDLRAAERRAAAAGYDLKAASAERWPSVSATGNWYLDRWNYSEFATKTRWDLGLVADLPLFLGGAIRARERIAESRIRQESLDRSRLLRAVVEDVDVAFVHLRAGIERLESLRTNERFARENLALLQEEYRQGLATNLEVFTAQILHQDAAVALERQEVQSRLDRIELFLAVGRDDLVGVPVPGVPASKEKP